MALAQIAQLGGLQGTLDGPWSQPQGQYRALDTAPQPATSGLSAMAPDDQGVMTYDKLMALSPQQRHDYLIRGDVTQYGYSPEYGYAANLRNIVQDENSWLPLSVDQYRTILGSSQIDPSMAQGIATNLGGILDDQNRARQDTTKDKIARAGAIATAVWAGGAGIAGALGAGAAGAGAGTGEGLAAGGATTSGGLGAGTEFGSFLGPTTGTVEAAPVIGGSGTPIVSGIAEGSSPFISGAGGLGSMMPGAVPESGYDLSNQGLFQTGPGQFEQMPMTAGGAGASLGTAGLGAGASIAEGGTASGGATAGGGAGAAAGGTALSRFLDGTATTADYLSLGGGLGAAGLGAYAANQQTQAYTDLANKYMAMGAPYRQKLSDLYANPSSYLQSSEVQVPVQQGTDALARALSIKGNPAGSGTALQELQNYSANQLYGRLGEEKNRLAGFGGLTQYNAAAPGASQAAIGAQGGIYNSIGYGLGQLTNPPSSLEQSLRAFRGGLGSLT